MKKILTLITIICIATTSYTQDFIYLYPNNNYDIGFGVYQKCDKHVSYIVNGPLFGHDKQPVGGYVMTKLVYNKETEQYDHTARQVKNWVDPERYKDNFKEDNGIFGLTQSRDMILQRYEDWIIDPIDLVWGFQNGMILVLNNKNLHSKYSRSKYVRSGIGYRNDGSLVVAISTHPINFYELGEALKNKGCANAIYLDGSSPTVGYRTPHLSEGLDTFAIKLQFYH